MNETKKKLLRAALDLFAEDGYDGVSMTRIAKDVGIKKASLYFHVQGKDALFFEVLDFVMEEFSGMIDRLRTTIADDADLFEALYAYLTGYIGYIADESILKFWTRIYVFPPPVITGERLAAVQAVDRKVFDDIVELISARCRKPAGEIAVFAQTVLRITGGYIALGLDMGPDDWRDELARELKLVTNGFFAR